MINSRFATFILAIFAGLLFFCQQADGKAEPYYRYKNVSNHGPVRSIVTTSYNKVPLQNEITAVDVKTYTIEEYDKNGDLKISSSYNTTRFVSRNTYHQNIKQGVYVVSNYAKNGDLINKLIYLENKKGNLTEIRSTNGTTWYITTKNEYDNRGNCIQTINFKNDGSISYKNITDFDENNRVVSDSTINGDNKLMRKTKNLWDKDGQLVYQKIGNVFNNIMRETVTRFRYLEKGKIVEKIDSSKNLINLSTTIYDIKRNIVESIYEFQGQKMRYVYTRNINGEEVKMDVYKNNVLVEMTSYDFDEHDNWIRKTETDLLNKSKIVTIREIKYYPALKTNLTQDTQILSPIVMDSVKILTIPSKPTPQQPYVLEANLNGVGQSLCQIELNAAGDSLIGAIKKATLWIMCNGQYQKIANISESKNQPSLHITLQNSIWNPEKIKLEITEMFLKKTDKEVAFNPADLKCFSNSFHSGFITPFEKKLTSVAIEYRQRQLDLMMKVKPYNGTLIALRNIKITPSNIAAPDNDVDKICDGKNYGEKTQLHTPWGGIKKQPVTIEAELDGIGKQLDAIVLDQRNLLTGGILKDVSIWVMTEGVYRLFATRQFPCKNERVTVEPDTLFVNPQKIKLVISDTYTDNGNYVVCLGELACLMYPKSTITKAKLNQDAWVFNDPLCTTLKPGLKRSDIDNMKVPIMKEWAQYLQENSYNPDSLTVTIQPLQHPDILCDSLHINSTFSLYDGVTGIELPKGDHLVMVDAPDDADVKIIFPLWLEKPKQARDFRNNDGGKLLNYSYNLKKGPNYISTIQNQLAYIQYFTKDNPDNHPDINVHFPFGKVNGSFDLRKGDTNESFKRLCKEAVNPILDIKGKYVQMAFPIDSIQKYTGGDIVKLLAVYDTIIGLQREFTGLNKQGIHFNNSVLCRMAYEYNMFTSQNNIGICDTILNTALNPDLVSTTWGIFDEAGHVFQLFPQLTWGGMVEVSNNIATQYSRSSLGIKNMLSKDNTFAEAKKAILGKGISYMDYPGMGPDSLQGNLTNTPIFFRIVPFWQLYLYFKEQGYPDYYADLMIAMRKQPRWQFGKENNNQWHYMLEFCRLACDVSKTDLTEFFDRWGFFYTGRQVLGDYMVYKYKIPQEEIDALKKDIAAKRYPKPRKDITQMEN